MSLQEQCCLHAMQQAAQAFKAYATPWLLAACIVTPAGRQVHLLWQARGRLCALIQREEAEISLCHLLHFALLLRQSACILHCRSMLLKL